MKEPRQWLMMILSDPYATDASKQAACKLYNGMRRQVTRRKQCLERIAVLLDKVENCKSAMEDKA